MGRNIEDLSRYGTVLLNLGGSLVTDLAWRPLLDLCAQLQAQKADFCQSDLALYQCIRDQLGCRHLLCLSFPQIGIARFLLY